MRGPFLSDGSPCRLCKGAKEIPISGSSSLILRRLRSRFESRARRVWTERRLDVEEETRTRFAYHSHASRLCARPAINSGANLHLGADEMLASPACLCNKRAGSRCASCYTTRPASAAERNKLATPFFAARFSAHHSAWAASPCPGNICADLRRFSSALCA